MLSRHSSGYQYVGCEAGGNAFWQRPSAPPGRKSVLSATQVLMIRLTHRRSGLMTLLALGAVCALWAKLTAPQDVAPSPTPAISASPASTPSPGGSRTPVAENTPQGPVAISVEHVWGGCFYSDKNQLEWRTVGDNYVSSIGSLSHAEVQELRATIRHSQQACDGLHGLGKPPTAKQVMERIHTLYPWVPGEPPASSDAALEKEIRHQALHGAVDQTTSHSQHTITLEGSPRVELKLRDQFSAQWEFNNSMMRLPRWTVRLDSGVSWTTSCAELSRRVIPLLPEQSRRSLEEIDLYFDEFVEMKARQVGDNWASRDAVTSYTTWSGYEAFEGRAKVSRLDIGWSGEKKLVVHLQGHPSASRAIFEYDVDQPLVTDWNKLMAQVAEVDRVLQRHTWVSAPEEGYTYRFPSSSQIHWPCLDLPGQPVVEITLGRAGARSEVGSPMLFLARDGRAVLQHATPEMRRALGIPKTAKTHATYLMTPDGKAKRVKSNVSDVIFGEDGVGRSVEDDLKGG